MRLPTVTEPLTIEGYSQSGASANTLFQGTDAVLKIELDGSAAGVASEAFRIRASDCVIKGLVINRFGGNSILRNSIFSNDGLGIDLDDDGATPNDPDDEDTGPNELQNKPGLISAENAGGETTVKGTLNSGPNETFKVRFYSNP